MTLEDMTEFLKKQGVEATLINTDEYGYSRTIEFSIYSITYRVVWFCNESTLRIGTGDRAAQIPFKYIYLDTTFPLIKGNKSIGFSYTKKKCTGIADREYPYEVFRVPLEIGAL